MAGTGRAPKFVENRRNAHAPQRGEWTLLEPLERPGLPSLPRGKWSKRTRDAWVAWGSDPATGVYGPAERQLALDLAYIYEQWVQGPTAALAGEIRQRLDGLGLSPKGKQDRRWRLVDAEPVLVEPIAQPTAHPEAPVRRLRAVDPAAAAG